MVILRHLSPYLDLDCWSSQMCWLLLSDPVKGSGFHVMPEPEESLPGCLRSYLPWLTTPFPLWALASFPGLHPKLRPRFPLVIHPSSLAGVFHLPRIYLWHSASGPFLPRLPHTLAASHPSPPPSWKHLLSNLK